MLLCLILSNINNELLFLILFDVNTKLLFLFIYDLRERDFKEKGNC